MSDQSSTLRKMAEERAASQTRPTHTIAVTSGKGGVGKSNMAVNLGIALAKRKRRVLLMDADMGLANVDILVGLASPYNLSHVLTGEKEITEVIAEGPAGLDILPASSGVEWMANLGPEQKMNFMQKMDALNGLYDILLIDTGAGIASNVTYFNIAAQTRLVVVTPEPTSLTDAYALIKVLHQSYHQKDFDVVVNNVSAEKEALEVYENLTTVADRFLDVRIGFMGYAVRDSHLPKAVRQQVPVVLLSEDAPISRCYRDIAGRIDNMPSKEIGGDIGLFWRNWLEAAPV